MREHELAFGDLGEFGDFTFRQQKPVCNCTSANAKRGKTKGNIDHIKLSNESVVFEGCLLSPPHKT